MRTPHLDAPLDYGVIWPVRSVDDLDHALGWLDRYSGPITLDKTALAAHRMD